MSEILVYCRPGYEVDTANEITAVTTEKNWFGYPTFKSGDGYIRFHFYQAEQAETFAKQVPVSTLIFARQVICVYGHLVLDDKSDRISPVLAELQDHSKGMAGQVWVEFADTEAGKELAKFCRKFNVPLRQQLRKAKLLTDKEREDKACYHLFFTDFDNATLGVSFAKSRAPFYNGICRLKFPPEAPSRSTLKLEEAILTQLTDNDRQRIFRAGARAVDLGACPGGWTYQLVDRGMYVESVDNGKMAENLMATGLVDYRAEDGFHYRPQLGHVELLVCDMIEQPDRVAKLMGDWICHNRANHAIFNLKLPMKRRYESVVAARTHIIERMERAGIPISLSIRHLYHDRDEVTVALIRQ